MREKGLFISFEGIEGVGKTTQAGMLKEFLEKQGYTVILTKEPGGTAIGDKIRRLLLSVEHKEMDAVTELLLYSASRRQHIKEVIEPALKKGNIVITDRFADSTWAYQGCARGIDITLIDSINSMVAGGFGPDLTILLDSDVETGLKRNRQINKTDRLELEDLKFHKKVRKGYRALLKKYPKRIRLINAGRGIGQTHSKIIKVVEGFLARA